MKRIQLFIALISAGVAAAPASAQLLGGLGGPIGSVVNGTAGIGGVVGGTLSGSSDLGGTLNRTTSGVTSSITGSVTGSANARNSRSVDTRSGSAGGEVGLAGTVAGAVDSMTGAGGLGQTHSLSGSGAGTASADKSASFGVQGLGTNHVQSMTAQLAGPAPGSVESARSRVRAVPAQATGAATTAGSLKGVTGDIDASGGAQAAGSGRTDTSSSAE